MPIFISELDQPGIFKQLLSDIGVRNQDLPVLEFLLSKKNCKVVCNHINAILPLNYLQCLIVEGILDFVITKKGQVQVAIEDQLLLYIRDKSGVRKSRDVQALELGFIFLGRQAELVIFVPMGCAADGIGGNTIHTTLKINTRAEKSFIVKANMF